MKKILSIIALVCAVLFVGFSLLNAYIYEEKQGDPATVSSYRGSLSGEVVCLPHRDTNGPQTMECALGLKTAVGEYYALDFLLLSQQYTPPETGTQFTASGMITPIELLSTDHWQKYDIEGVFTVTDSIEE